MGERFEGRRLERLNAQGVDGRDCPLCYLVRSNTLVGERRVGQVLRCTGCFATFSFYSFGPAPLYDVLERVPTSIPARPLFVPATDAQHNAGARIADDHSCDCCGKRGVIGTCNTCLTAA